MNRVAKAVASPSIIIVCIVRRMAALRVHAARAVARQGIAVVHIVYLARVVCLVRRVVHWQVRMARTVFQRRAGMRLAPSVVIFILQRRTRMRPFLEAHTYRMCYIHRRLARTANMPSHLRL